MIGNNLYNIQTSISKDGLENKLVKVFQDLGIDISQDTTQKDIFITNVIGELIRNFGDQLPGQMENYLSKQIQQGHIIRDRNLIITPLGEREYSYDISEDIWCEIYSKKMCSLLALHEALSKKETLNVIRKNIPSSGAYSINLLHNDCYENELVRTLDFSSSDIRNHSFNIAHIRKIAENYAASKEGENRYGRHNFLFYAHWLDKPRLLFVSKNSDGGKWHYYLIEKSVDKLIKAGTKLFLNYPMPR